MGDKAAKAWGGEHKKAARPPTAPHALSTNKTAECTYFFYNAHAEFVSPREGRLEPKLLQPLTWLVTGRWLDNNPNKTKQNKKPHPKQNTPQLAPQA